MVSHFSNSYQRGRAYIEVTSGEVGEFETDISRLSENQYHIVDELYSEAGSDRQPVFKIDEKHFQVVEDSDLPMDTLVLSEEVVHSLDRSFFSGYTDYFVLDPRSKATEHVLEMFQKSSYDPSLL